MVFSGNAMPRKRVVRSWARRRIDHAVAEALRMRGFDRSGKRLVDGGVTTMGKVRSRGVSHEQTTPCIQDSLVGTVDVQILNPSVEANFKEVQRQAGLVVEEILRVCGGHNHNRNLDFFRSQKC